MSITIASRDLFRRTILGYIYWVLWEPL